MMKWTKPEHYLIKRLCANPWCQVETRKNMRFCSETCMRSVMTVEELNRAVGFEADQDQKSLDTLIDSAVERAREKWLKALPPVLKARWNVRDDNCESHS